MQAFRSVLRWYFALLAVIAFRLSWSQWRADSGHVPDMDGMIEPNYLFAIFAIFAVLPTIAWLTTRKPTGERNWWAVATFLTQLWPLYFILTWDKLFIADGVLWLLMAGNIAGVVAFSIRLKSAPAAAVKNVAGDRTSRYADTIITLITIAVATHSIRIWDQWGYAQDIPRESGTVALALIGLVTVLVTTLHECGHAAVGKLFDMKLLAFKAGPFQGHLHLGRWKFKFVPAGIIAFSGAVNVVPTKPNQSRWCEVAMIAGGPLVNVITGLIAGYAALSATNTASFPAWSFLAYFSSISLVVAFANLLPFRTGNHYSDGARILQALTNSPLAEYHRAIMDVQSTLVTSRRLIDVDRERLERVALRYTDDVIGLHLRLLIAEHYEATGDLVNACIALSAAQAIHDEFKLDLSAHHRACFVLANALMKRDAAATRLWWERYEAKQPEELNWIHWEARTAYLWMENRLEEANDALQKAVAAVSTLPETGAYNGCRDTCADLRRHLDEAQNTCQAPQPVQNAPTPHEYWPNPENIVGVLTPLNSLQ